MILARGCDPQLVEIPERMNPPRKTPGCGPRGWGRASVLRRFGDGENGRGLVTVETEEQAKLRVQQVGEVFRRDGDE